MAGSCAGTAAGGTPPAPALPSGGTAAGAAAPGAATRSAFPLAGAGAATPPPDDVLEPARLQPASARRTQMMAAPVRQREIEGVMRVRRRASGGRFRQT